MRILKYRPYGLPYLSAGADAPAWQSGAKDSAVIAGKKALLVFLFLSGILHFGPREFALADEGAREKPAVVSIPGARPKTQSVPSVRRPAPAPVHPPVPVQTVSTLPRPVKRVVETAPPAESSAAPSKPETIPAEKVAPRSRPRPKTPAAAEPAQSEHNLYVEEFFISPDLRLQRETTDVQGFVFLKTPSVERKTNYSLVTNFKDKVMQTRYVPGLKTMKDAEKWVESTLKTAEFEGVEIRSLTFPSPDGTGPGTPRYWVGHRSFDTVEEAQSQIALMKSIVESQGGDFNAMVEGAKEYLYIPSEQPVIEIKTPAQFAKEEALLLKWSDQMNFGTKLFGPFQGEAAGEPVLWQSFGETTWRNTNLESLHFNEQVGFWTNRLVFRGIRFPVNTINLYIEETTAMEAVAADFKSNLKFFAGAEWRPFERNEFFYNFRPWSLPLLIWMRNFRLYVQYGNRYNIKDEILGSAGHDLIWGVEIFYEWGIDLPSVQESAIKPDNIPDFLRKYTWGEYFGNHRVEMTNFGIEDDFNAFIWNGSLILGFHLPGIPLPPNPINDEFALMPYMRFEHVSNERFSFPFQNRYFVAAGIRWMPFRNYRYKESEWLTKFKIFFEYVGIGKVQNTRVSGEEVPYAVREDFRVGVAFSSRRF